MSTTEKRVVELLDRWQASVELHLRYLKLDDAAYARAEAWPKHQRPNPMVVNLARTRLLELKAHLNERRDAGDAKFAESLELMSFLTSLLGSEHIERFIPLATGRSPDPGVSGTVEQPRIRAVAKSASTQRSNGTSESHVATKTAPAGMTHKASAGTHKRPARPRAPSASAPTPQPAARPEPVRAPPSPPSPPKDAMTQQVIADAIRMLEWGREWPAVAGLIARMADRPSEAEIWKILRTYRNDILARSRRTG